MPNDGAVGVDLDATVGAAVVDGAVGVAVDVAVGVADDSFCRGKLTKREGLFVTLG